MNHVQRRGRSRGTESILMNAVGLGLMFIGTVVAILVVIATIGYFLGVFSF